MEIKLPEGVYMIRSLHSIRTRFILSVLLTVMIFLGMLLLLSYTSLKNAALESAQELSATVLSETDRRIDSFFGEIESIASSLSMYQAFYEVRPEEMKSIILAFVEARREYLRAIYIGTVQGQMYEWGIGPGFVDNAPVFEPGYDPRDRPWYRKGVQKDCFAISEPYLYASIEAVGITGVMPVYDKQGGFVGVLGVDILLDDLARMIEQLKVQKNGKVILLNRDNEVIVNQFNETGRNPSSDLAEFNFFDLDLLDRCPSGTLMEPMELNGRYYVTCTVNNMTGWKLIVAFPYEALIASAVESTKNIVYLEVVMMLFLAAALAVLSNAMIMKPLLGTIRVIEKLENSDTGARLPEDRRDEFGLLARQFNHLIETVGEYRRSLEEKVRKRTEELMRLQRENMRLRLIEEKERIYGYLHDSLGARLTNINVSNTVAQSALERDPKILREMLERIEENTHQGIADLQEILHGSAPDGRKMIDFVRTVETQIRERLELKNILLSCEMKHPDELNGLSRQIRFELEKILQELSSNVLKHSGATSVDVHLGIRGGRVVLVFSDNGAGGADLKGEGYGLENMRRRVTHLGGAFKMVSPKGQGTKIRIDLPVEGGDGDL